MPLGVSAQDNSGWRPPTKADLGDDIAWREKDPSLYLTAVGDFDGDGKQDSVSLLVNDKQDKMGLFIQLGSRPGKKIELTSFKYNSRVGLMGVRIAQPGKYRTACGKGYWACQKGEPEELNLELPAINFFKEESRNSFFVWNKKTRKFQRIWITD